MNTAAIAQHLNVLESAITEVQEWARVLWVRVKGIGCRFVSKKVVEMDSVVYKSIEMKPVTKSVMEVSKNGVFFKRMDITAFSLDLLNIPARQQDAILFDLRKAAGLKNTQSPAKTESSRKSNINPKWVMFNDVHNEGCEGFNPYPKYL